METRHIQPNHSALLQHAWTDGVPTSVVDELVLGGVRARPGRLIVWATDDRRRRAASMDRYVSLCHTPLPSSLFLQCNGQLVERRLTATATCNLQSSPAKRNASRPLQSQAHVRHSCPLQVPLHQHDTIADCSARKRIPSFIPPSPAIKVRPISPPTQTRAPPSTRA